MTPEQIIQLLDELQRRLDGPGRYVFELAIRQVVIESVVSWLVVAALGGLTVFCAWHLRRASKLEDEKGTYSSDGDKIFMYGLIGALSAMISGLIFFIALIFAIGSAANLLNPEWAALTKILNSIRP